MTDYKMDDYRLLTLPQGKFEDPSEPWDKPYEFFADKVKKESCTTCAHFALEMGMLPKCMHSGRVGAKSGEGVRLGDTAKSLDAEPSCAKKAGRNRWKIHPHLTLAYKFTRHKQANEFAETDYYEVYQHFTGEVKKVSRGWWAEEKEVKCSFFYILKNSKYYYCRSSGGTYGKGFALLSDFKPWTKLLVTYEEAEDAISQCEIFNSWGNKHGNLVYSTGGVDSLEQRFRDLESAGARRKRKQA